MSCLIVYANANIFSHPLSYQDIQRLIVSHDCRSQAKWVSCGMMQSLGGCCGDGMLRPPNQIMIKVFFSSSSWFPQPKFHDEESCDKSTSSSPFDPRMKRNWKTSAPHDHLTTARARPCPRACLGFLSLLIWLIDQLKRSRKTLDHQVYFYHQMTGWVQSPANANDQPFSPSKDIERKHSETETSGFFFVGIATFFILNYFFFIISID